MLKLLVVEDHALVREGLVQTLRQLADDVEVFEANSCDCACAILADTQDFDLVLLDLGLPGVDGLSCLGILRQRYPSTPVVIVSAYDDVHTVNRALKNGASGFVPKAYTSERLIAALREVLDGQVFTPDRTVPMSTVADLPNMPIGGTAKVSDFGLTERQSSVLALMARGKSNRQIGEQLGLSEGTIKVHITALFKNLGVSSRTQALVVIARYGIKL